MEKIHDPAELKNYTEEQIYRDPNSDDIYLRDGVQSASPADMSKKLEQEENILGRSLTEMEVAKMYPEYAGQYGNEGLGNLTQKYNQQQQASQGVQNLGNPNNVMNALQRGIKIKNKVAEQGIGQSEIFKKAGLTGIGALAQSLSARGNEIKMDYTNLSNFLTQVSGNLQDQANNVLNSYKIAANEYDQEMSRISDIDNSIREYKQAIELYAQKAEIDKGVALWEAEQDKTPITNVGGYDISSYATDPNHETSVQNIMSSIGKFNDISDVDAYIKQVAPNSPITGEMISKASEKYGVDWEMMVAMMQQDSSLGTAGKGARTFNPGNVGNDDAGNERNFGDWPSGVNAVADWLSKHKTSKTEQPVGDTYNEDTKLELSITPTQKNGLIGLGFQASSINQLLLNIQTAGYEDTINQLILDNGDTEEVQAIIDYLNDIYQK